MSEYNYDDGPFNGLVGDNMPDKMFIAEDERIPEHYLAGLNFEEGDTEYTRTELVKELIYAAEADMTANRHHYFLLSIPH